MKYFVAAENQQYPVNQNICRNAENFSYLPMEE